MKCTHQQQNLKHYLQNFGIIKKNFKLTSEVGGVLVKMQMLLKITTLSRILLTLWEMS